MSNVKGSKLTSKLSFLRERYGDDSVEKVIAAMPPEDQATLRFVLDVSWYPQDLYDRLVETIRDTVGKGDPAILDEIGHHSAQHQLTHIFKAYRGKELEETLRNQVIIHSRVNDPGRMTVDIGDHRCTIIVEEPKSTLTSCRIARAFYERTVELYGANRVQVEEPECSANGDPRCRFELTWEPAGA